jgi:hypothetical protein
MNMQKIIALLYAGFLCLTASHAFAVTGCAAVKGKTPQDAPGIECPSPPCDQNACQYSLSNDGNFNNGTYSSCGPLTLCVLQGEDPPVSNPQWDESANGFMSLGSTITSGKCDPPPAGGSGSISSVTGTPTLGCPVQSLLPR